MIAYKDLGDILKATTSLEAKLKDYYDVAEYAMRREESKQTIASLRERHVAKMQVLQEIDVRKYGKTEWVKYAPGLREKDLIPIGKLSRDAEPGEILEQILSFEEKLEEFYRSLAAKIVVRSQQELFESLSAFKSEQAEEIRRSLAG